MTVVISQTVLVVAEPFGDALDAERVAAAIGRGMEADAQRERGGRFECDLFPIETSAAAGQSTRPIVARPATRRNTGRRTGSDTRRGAGSALLDALGFDERMRAARAVVIARGRLDDRTLAGTLAFEVATRARQAGVPAYAVTGENALDPFEARIVDLQVILEASTPRALSAAGRKLAALV